MGCPPVVLEVVASILPDILFPFPNYLSYTPDLVSCRVSGVREAHPNNIQKDALHRSREPLLVFPNALSYTPPCHSPGFHAAETGLRDIAAGEILNSHGARKTDSRNASSCGSLGDLVGRAYCTRRRKMRS